MDAVLAQGPQDRTQPGHRAAVALSHAVAQAANLGCLALGTDGVLDLHGRLADLLVARPDRQRHSRRHPVLQVGVQLLLELDDHLLRTTEDEVFETLDPEDLEGDLPGPAQVVVHGVGPVIGDVVAVPVAAVVLVPG